MPARARNLVLYAVAAGVGGVVLYLLLPHLGPLILGLLLAVLIDRPVTGLERRGVPRAAAAFIVLSLAVLGAVALAGWFGAALYAEVRELARILPPSAPGLPPDGAVLPASGPSWMEPVPPLVQELIRRAVESAYGAATQWVEGVVRAVARLPSLIWPLTVTALIAYFASRDRPLLAAVSLSYTPRTWRVRAARLGTRLLLQVAAFLHAQLLVVTLSAALSAAALLLLGLPYALSLGLLAGLLDLIPYLGPTAVFGVLAATRLLQGSPQGALAACLAGLVVFGARQLAETRMVAGRTQLHPLTVVSALYLGSRLFGATGFLLGPVLALAVKAVLAELGGPVAFRR